MSTSVTFNGTSYTVPAISDASWGNKVSTYLIAIASGCLQKTGGSFTLSAEVDFGATYGLKTAYYKSRGTVSTTGVMRLANNESVSWLNAAGNADLALKVNSSNTLEFNGADLPFIDLGAANTVLRVNSGGTAVEYAKLVDANIASAAAIAVNKLAALTVSRAAVTDASGFLAAATTTATEIGYVNGVTSAIQTQLDAKLNKAVVAAKGDIYVCQSIGPLVVSALSAGTNNQLLAANSAATTGLNYVLLTNSNVDSSAGIAYSKLNLTGTILNADINASAAIAYSKLNLSGSILNADINASAAIAYSKLNLSASIVNADIGASAAIAVSKLAALTASRATVTDGSGFVSAATTTATEIGYVNGVTSAIQTQLDAKQLRSTLTTKGDLYVATASNTVTRLGIGTNGYVLTADSAQTTGMVWSSPSTPTFTTITTSDSVNENNATFYNSHASFSNNMEEIRVDRAGTTSYNFAYYKSNYTSSARDAYKVDGVGNVTAGNTTDAGNRTVEIKAAASSDSRVYLTAGSSTSTIESKDSTTSLLITPASTYSFKSSKALISTSSVKAVASADYTITDTDGYDTVLVTTGASGRTMTLPAVANNAGRTLTIKKVDSGAGTINIAVNGGLIDGASTNGINSQYGYVTLKGDGSNWTVIGCTDYIAVSNASYVSMSASATWQDSGSNLGLLPGEWNITLFHSWIYASTTFTEVDFGIGTASGGSTTGLIAGDTQSSIAPPVPAAGTYTTSVIPDYKVRITANTTYYGKIRTFYTGTAPTFAFRFSARRVG